MYTSLFHHNSNEEFTASVELFRKELAFGLHFVSFEDCLEYCLSIVPLLEVCQTLTIKWYLYLSVNHVLNC